MQSLRLFRLCGSDDSSDRITSALRRKLGNVSRSSRTERNQRAGKQQKESRVETAQLVDPETASNSAVKLSEDNMFVG